MIKNLLSHKVFLQGFFLLKENFEFDASECYIDLIYGALKDKIDNLSFQETIQSNLFDVSKEKWNKIYGYKGRPSLKDWLDAFIITIPPSMIKKHKLIKCANTEENILQYYYDYPDWYLDYLQERTDRKNNQQLKSINN